MKAKAKREQLKPVNVERSLIAAAMSGPDAVRFIASQLGTAELFSGECQGRVATFLVASACLVMSWS